MPPVNTLKRAKNQNDTRILTYYGFTNRKLGNVDVAFDYYNRAISADANNLLARSYMGQGLVQQGKLEEARAQLVEIRDRGGKDTYAYDALYQALKSGSTY
jgi:tetratricopeptide (TPR) repeat protein